MPLRTSELATMKLVDLRQQLRLRKLPTSGNKKTLMARLAAQLTEREISNPSASSDSTQTHTSDGSESPDTTSEPERSQSRQRDSRHRQRDQASSDQSPPLPSRDPQRSSRRRRRRRHRQRGRHADMPMDRTLVHARRYRRERRGASAPPIAPIPTHPEGHGVPEIALVVAAAAATTSVEAAQAPTQNPPRRKVPRQHAIEHEDAADVAATTTA